MHVSELDLFRKIDFDRIDLPSDGITVKYLRRHFPRNAEFVLADEGERLDAMWDAERLTVLLGYASVLGKEAEARVKAAAPDGDAAAMTKNLAADLIHYGLAEGPATAARVIKNLKDAGATIARQQLGRPGR